MAIVGDPEGDGEDHLFEGLFEWKSRNRSKGWKNVKEVMSVLKRSIRGSTRFAQALHPQLRENVER